MKGKKEFKSWFDLSVKERVEFAKMVRHRDVQGWEQLENAAEDFGFEATEDMPTVYELKELATGRKFGGRVFSNVASKPTKKEAGARARAWRAKGFLARVVKVKGGYDIYVREATRGGKAKAEGKVVYRKGNMKITEGADKGRSRRSGKGKSGRQARASGIDLGAGVERGRGGRRHIGL